VYVVLFRLSTFSVLTQLYSRCCTGSERS
jgi:hypothetical protein